MEEAWLTQCCQRQPVLLHSHAGLFDAHLDTTHIDNLAQFTQTKWVSLHFDVPSGPLFNWHKRLGFPIPFVTQAKAYDLALQNMTALKSKLAVPVALENQAYHRYSGHNYVTEPDFLQRVLADTATYLLLDLGHARVSAAMWQLPIEDYLQQLPLERVLEIHISGPRIYRGRLRDVHAPLQAIDYQILQDVLRHTPHIQAVTLEYYGDQSILLEQLQQLRHITTKIFT